MILVNNPGDWGNVYAPLLHAKWHGCTPTDLVFPFFLFMVGVSIAIALGKRKDRGDDPRAMYRKIGGRTLSIFGLGLFLTAFPHFKYEGAPLLQTVHYLLMGVFMLSVFAAEAHGSSRLLRTLIWGAAAGMLLIGLSGHYHLSTLRIPGVLQRIALVYGITSLIFLHVSLRGQALLGAGLLLLYWGLMALVPVPGGIAPNLEPETNLGAWLDRAILGTSHLWSQSKTWDPEGLLGTLPAVGTGLVGVLSGELLRSALRPVEKCKWLLISGALLVVLGQVWNLAFPINKALWTSSYVLYAGGLAQLALALIYWVVDLKGIQSWGTPFRIYGVNALFAFALSGIFAKLLSAIKWQDAAGEAQTLKGWLYEGFFTPFLSPVNASLAFALFNVGVLFLCCWGLYRKNIFIKV
ncbi:MAG: hypothetical protein RL181_568 [Bacteroidota bacterium]